MLKEEVVQAVRDEKFHIWPVVTVEEGIEILTDVPAGEKDESGRYPADSVHGRANARLEEYARILKEFGRAEEEEKKPEEERRLAAQRTGEQ